MGEAKRKKAQLQGALDVVNDLNLEVLCAAVRQVVAATTSFHGGDCLLFASVGAGALRAMGVSADPVAGSAIWRVGPGDSDTISHAREMVGPLYAQGTSGKALQFHAWVEAPGLLIDFSMGTLALKAAQLDAADGGSTTVAWAPSYLWVKASGEVSSGQRLRTPQAVNASYDVGTFCYIRHRDIEALVMPDVKRLMEDTGPAAQAAVMAYQAMLAGNQIRVAGVGLDGIQTEPQSAELQVLSEQRIAELKRALLARAADN